MSPMPTFENRKMLVTGAVTFERPDAALDPGVDGIPGCQAAGAARRPGISDERSAPMRLEVQRASSRSMAPAIFAGVMFGPKRSTTLPCLFTRNLVKFHLMRVVPRMPGFSERMNL